MPSQKLAQGKSLQRLQSISGLLPAADALAFFRSLLDAYKEEQNVRREMARIEATRDVVLAEISHRYDLYRTVFTHIFDERKGAIEHSFDVINSGLASNDKELVVSGLRTLSAIVSSSPFSNLEELGRMLQSDRKIEI